MGGPQVARRSLAIAALVLLLSVTGCAGNTGSADGLGDGSSPNRDRAAVSKQDSDAITQLAEIAARDAEPEGAVDAVECWTPSQNPVQGVEREPQSPGETADTGAQEFRVLCRVHFEQQGAGRYRDMICIGDLGRDPVAEYCYQWAYYADAPKFEDRPAFTASAAR